MDDQIRATAEKLCVLLRQEQDVIPEQLAKELDPEHLAWLRNRHARNQMLLTAANHYLSTGVYGA